jgi:hypothetical protein
MALCGRHLELVSHFRYLDDTGNAMKRPLPGWRAMDRMIGENS